MTDPPPSPPKILVVDDSALVRRQVASALADAGFAVVEAIDGEDARCKLHEAPDTRLVVCDVTMPRMNGIELLERIRAEPRFAKLPVIMLTTEGRPELIHRAKALGAKGWLVKPFKSDILISAIQRLAKPA
jgi:two-component system chemotaxis response regulator CheY